MIMAKIQELYDRATGEAIYPRTCTEAVYDSQGRDLETRLVSVEKDTDDKLADYTTATQLRDGLAAKQDALTITDDLELTARGVLSVAERAKREAFYDMWDSACVMQGQLFTDGSCAVPVIGEADRNKGTCTISDTELDYSDAVKVSLCRKMLMGTNLQEAYSASNVGVQKAFFPIVSSGATSTYGMYSGQSKVRVVQLGQYNGRLSSSNAGYMFYGCTSLEEIRGRLELLTNDTSRTFTVCTSLREVRLRIGSQCSGVSILDCPHLSLESIQWLIDDRLGSHDATVTVHPDVFAKLTGDTSNAAAAALTEVELAQWAQALDAAMKKNITFATI